MLGQRDWRSSRLTLLSKHGIYLKNLPNYLSRQQEQPYCPMAYLPSIFLVDGEVFISQKATSSATSRFFKPQTRSRFRFQKLFWSLINLVSQPPPLATEAKIPILSTSVYSFPPTLTEEIPRTSNVSSHPPPPTEMAEIPRFLYMVSTSPSPPLLDAEIIRLSNASHPPLTDEEEIPRFSNMISTPTPPLLDAEIIRLSNASHPPLTDEEEIPRFSNMISTPTPPMLDAEVICFSNASSSYREGRDYSFYKRDIL
jgi:hypothetical protein